MFAARAKDAGELAIRAGVSFCAGMPTGIVFAVCNATRRKRRQRHARAKAAVMAALPAWLIVFPSFMT